MKADIIEYLKILIQERISEAQESIASTKASRDSDSKSTAGDKHEVGRAMAQIELENQEAQLHRNLKLQEDLENIRLDRSTEEIGRGSLVLTDSGKYFVSIGLGAVEIGQEMIFVISEESPIGQLLRSKSAGDIVDFNGKRIEILNLL